MWARLLMRKMARERFLYSEDLQFGAFCTVVCRSRGSGGACFGYGRRDGVGEVRCPAVVYTLVKRVLLELSS